jgi:hypothetical protein
MPSISSLAGHSETFPGAFACAWPAPALAVLSGLHAGAHLGVPLDNGSDINLKTREQQLWLCQWTAERGQSGADPLPLMEG